MHVRDDEVHASVVVEIEKLYSHGSPRSFRKELFGLVDEVLATCVFQVVVVSLHVQKEEAGESFAVQIGKGGVAAPSGRVQADFRGYVFEAVVAQISVKNRVFKALGM